jgi:hypothetical protein
MRRRINSPSVIEIGAISHLKQTIGILFMDSNKNLEKLAPDDVVSLTTIPFEKGSTVKVTQILEEYYSDIYNKFNQYKATILREGIECEILRVNEGKWRKGKIKLILEFEPDEIEIKTEVERSSDSLLDDIRQEIE